MEAQWTQLANLIASKFNTTKTQYIVVTRSEENIKFACSFTKKYNFKEMGWCKQYENWKYVITLLKGKTETCTLKPNTERMST